MSFRHIFYSPDVSWTPARRGSTVKGEFIAKEAEQWVSSQVSPAVGRIAHDPPLLAPFRLACRLPAFSWAPHTVEEAHCEERLSDRHPVLLPPEVRVRASQASGAQLECGPRYKSHTIGLHERPAFI